VVLLVVHTADARYPNHVSVLGNFSVLRSFSVQDCPEEKISVLLYSTATDWKSIFNIGLMAKRCSPMERLTVLGSCLLTDEDKVLSSFNIIESHEKSNTMEFLTLRTVVKYLEALATRKYL